MTNSHRKPMLKILGFLAVDEKGEYVFIKVSESPNSAFPIIQSSGKNSFVNREGSEENTPLGRIIDSPTPGMAKVQEEQAKDYSLEGRLKKAKEEL